MPEQARPDVETQVLPACDGRSTHLSAQPDQLGYVVVDVKRARLSAADNFAAVAGFDLGSEAGLDLATASQRVFQHVAPHDRERVRAVWAEIARGQRVGRMRFDTIDTHGSPRTLESVWSIEADASGEPRKVIVTCIDATARGHAEVTARDSEARYRLALRAGRMGSWETDLVAGKRIWSQEAMELFGLDLPGGIGQVGGEADEYYNALHPDDRHLRDHYHEIADRQDSFSAEYRVVRPDGTQVWLSGRGLVVARGADGRAQRIVSMMADVSDRRQVERELRFERGRLQQALQAGRMGAYDLNVVDDVLWWSPQMYAVFGVDPATFTPTRDSVSALLHPDDLPIFLRERAEAFEQHKPFSVEFRNIRPDGSLGWIGHLGQAEYDAHGVAVRSYGIAMDITERKRAEEALRDADRKKDHFIATLAHELRNPLAPIRNAVSLLRKTEQADPVVAWSRDVIDRQVAQMAHLLEDLLDVSRMTRGHIHLRRERLDFARVIEQAIEIARPFIDEAGHTLKVSMPGQTLRVEGDLTRLAQVFSNLLINAAKYTPPKGSIALTVVEHAFDVETRIRDTGIGIGAEQLHNIFEMFGQAVPARDRLQEGLGIGLALAKGLVALHGGQISAHSEGIGLGSEFIVRLPASARTGQGHASARSDVAAATDAGSMRILVADDLRDSADSLAKLLEAMGHTVSVAYDGEQAVQAAESFRPELALLDLGMPKLNGYDACRRIREQPWGRAMTLVAQTGWGRDKDRQQTMEAGFDHHIVKPIDIDALLALIETDKSRRAQA